MRLQGGERNTHDVAVGGDEPLVGNAWEGEGEAVSVCSRLRVAAWNAQGLGKVPAKGKMAAAARSQEKMAWLRDWLKEDEPDVVALLEVHGNARHNAQLRYHLRAAGYAMSLHAGRAEGAQRNGVVVAWRQATTWAMSTRAVHDRVAGVVIGVRGSDARVAVAAIHGLSRDAAYLEQLSDMEAWLEQQGGGIAIGDFNHVACSKWREQGTGLSQADRCTRDFVGAVCECCGEAESGLQWVRAPGGPGYTRHANSGQSWGPGTSYIDYAVATGAEEGRWRWAKNVAAETEEGAPLSDHYAIMVERSVNAARPVARRPSTVRIRGGKLEERVGAEFRTTVRTHGFRAAVHAARMRARAEGRHESPVVAAAVVAAAREAQLCVREAAAAARRGAAGPRGGVWRRNDERQQWRARVERALQLQREGADPWREAAFFHPKVKALREVRAQYGAARHGDVWEAVVRRCRRALRQADAKATAAARRAAAERVQLLTAAEKQDDAIKRLQAVWRALSARKASAAMAAVHKNDDTRKPKVRHTEPSFVHELGNIGRKFVRGMDRGAFPKAFRAWCAVFQQPFAEITGVDGGTWRLEAEFTWDVFIQAVGRMRQGKAVGVDGVAIELLRAAGEPVLRELYQAILQDVQADVVPAQWRVVLYSLLVKPPPNNPDVVDQRREIALMSQMSKLALHMARWTAYRRLTGRICQAQLGWLPGYGVAEAGLTVALAVQQARVVQHPLYVLYIDLAQMFPSIAREICDEAELLAGLPPAVQELSARVYGRLVAERRSSTEVGTQFDSPVQCRYDSEAGLGDSYENHMGALMGCVNSPDKAKIVLHSVLIAIAAVVKGVRWWGADGMGGDDQWAAVCQAAFADDWCGVFTSASQLEEAWEIWRAWEVITGSKLGVKRLSKTVVTGVRWEQGRPREVGDPKLRTMRGERVPYMPYWRAYKHLGVMRRADGSNKDARALLKQKLMAAVRRLARLRRPTLADFMLTSDALLGATAGFYGQTMVVDWGLSEEAEIAWRGVFNRKFKRLRDAPRVELYTGDGSGRRHRMHVHSHAATALATSMCRAAADHVRTPQRTAARSAIALAMHRWGCRGDPRVWRWAQLEEAIAAHVESDPTQYLGDGWLLAMCMARSQHDTHEQRDGDKAQFDAEELRSGAWMWQHEPEDGDPLSPSAPHFALPASRMLFTPCDAGGCGLAPAASMLHAGVVALGHMCMPAHAGPRFMSYAEAGKRLHLTQSVLAARQWEESVRALEEAGWRAVAPERVVNASMWWQEGGLAGWGVAEVARGSVDKREMQRLAGWLGTEDEHLETEDDGCEYEGACGRCGGSVTYCKKCEVDFCCVCETAGCAGRSEEAWAAQLRRCFPGVTPAAAVAWDTGSGDVLAKARGASVFVDTVLREGWRQGGEAGWRARGDVSEEGYADGWEAEEAAVDQAWCMDADGYMMRAVRNAAGQVVRRLHPTQGELLRAPVAVRMAANAREALGERDVDTGDEWERTAAGKWVSRKVSDKAINANAARSNYERVLRWCCRVRATAVYTLDGSRKVIKVGKSKELRSARAAIRHDGTVYGGRLAEQPEGHDNYLAELAAQLDCLAAEPAGSRIVVVCDATSPVLALLRYRTLHARAKADRYVASWLNTFEQCLVKHEAVVFVWQPSHTGAPINAWADKEAGAQLHSEVQPVLRGSIGYASMRFAAVRCGVRRWLAPRIASHAAARLARVVRHTVLWSSKRHMRIQCLSDKEEACIREVRGLRYQMADARRDIGGQAKRMRRTVTCPFGCVGPAGAPSPYTWWHVQFQCQHCELTQLRRAYASDLKEAASAAMGASDTGLPLQDVDQTLAAAQSAAQSAAWQANDPSERKARQVVTRIVQLTDGRADSNGGVLQAMRVAVASGIAVQLKGKEIVAEQEAAWRETLSRRRLLSKVLGGWADVWRGSSAGRVTALAVLRGARLRAMNEVGQVWARGDMSDAAWRQRADRVHVAVAEGIGRVTAGAVASQGSRARAALLGMAWARLQRAGEGRRWSRECARDVSAIAEAARHAQGGDAVVQLDGRWQAAYPIEVREGGAIMTCAVAPSWQEMEHAMRRRFMRAGGMAAVEAATTRDAKAARVRMRVRMAAAIQRYLKQGSCSGAPLAPVGATVTLVCGVDAAEKRRRYRRRHAAARRAPAEEAAEEGQAPLVGSKKWRVEELVEVRVRKGGADVLIRWKGRDGQWVDGWEPIRSGWLTGDVYEAAWDMVEAAGGKRPKRAETKAVALKRKAADEATAAEEARWRATSHWAGRMRQRATKPAAGGKYPRLQQDVDDEEEREMRRLEAGASSPQAKRVAAGGREAARPRPSADAPTVWRSVGEMLRADGRRMVRMPGDGNCAYWCMMAADFGGDWRTDLTEYGRLGQTPLREAYWSAELLDVREVACEWWDDDARWEQVRAQEAFCPTWEEWMVEAVQEAAGRDGTREEGQAAIRAVGAQNGGRLTARHAVALEEWVAAHAPGIAEFINRDAYLSQGEESGLGADRRYIVEWVYKHLRSGVWAEAEQLCAMAATFTNECEGVIVINSAQPHDTVEVFTTQGQRTQDSWRRLVAAGNTAAVLVWNGNNHYDVALRGVQEA
jgi:hypothetical protein